LITLTFLNLCRLLSAALWALLALSRLKLWLAGCLVLDSEVVMQTSDKGIALIKEFEGCKLTAYQDSVGVWTIGYGWTQPVDGKPIRAGMTIKQETAAPAEDRTGKLRK
jgi:hypothetical protein